MPPPLFVAELSINHLGMVNIAKQMIITAKQGGADFIKLKLKNVDDYYKDDGKVWRNFAFKKYRKSLELSKNDFHELDKFCKQVGIQWFSTVHDIESLEFIKQFSPPFYKIASMDTSRISFVEKVILACKAENTTLILSIGGKTDRFTSEIIELINKHNIRAHILHTVSVYPTPIGHSNINYIRHLKKTFESDSIKIGYSGHEVGFAASVFAASLGVSMLERHYTLSRNFKIHHIDAALEPNEFENMINIISDFYQELSTDSKDYRDEEFKFLERREYE